MSEELSAWHAVDGTVYHNNARCRIGRLIEPSESVAGDGALEQCGECVRLNANPRWELPTLRREIPG